jgi:hypothetical protein
MYRYTNIPFAGITVNKRYDFIGPLYEDGELQLNSYGQPIVKYYRNYILYRKNVNGFVEFGEPDGTEEGVDWEFNIPFEVAKLLTYDLSDKEVQTDTEEEEDEEHGGKKSKKTKSKKNKSKKNKSKKTKKNKLKKTKKTKSKNKKRFTRRI